MIANILLKRVILQKTRTRIETKKQLNGNQPFKIYTTDLTSMKKYIFLILCNILASFNIQAQYTLTSSAIPLSGETYTLYLADTSLVRAGNAGPSQVWDFSGLKITPKKSISRYVLATNTPYASQFVNSAMASESDMPLKNYVYMSTRSDSIFIDGTADTLYQTTYQLNNQIYMTYPFSYGSTLSDAFAGTFQLAGNPYVRNGSWNVKADAYGTLILPSGSYSNTLRLHSVQIQNDVFITTTTTTDAWYSQISKLPLLSISKVARIGYATSTAHWVMLNSDVVGIEEIKNTLFDFSIHPNPINEKAICTFKVQDRSEITLSLYNLQGEKVQFFLNKSYTHGEYSEEIEFKDLPSGLYFLTLLSSKNKIERIKIVKP